MVPPLGLSLAKIAWGPRKSSGPAKLMGGADIPKGVFKEVKRFRGTFSATNYCVKLHEFFFLFHCFTISRKKVIVTFFHLRKFAKAKFLTENYFLSLKQGAKRNKGRNFRWQRRQLASFLGIGSRRKLKCRREMLVWGQERHSPLVNHELGCQDDPDPEKKRGVQKRVASKKCFLKNLRIHG